MCCLVLILRMLGGLGTLHRPVLEANKHFQLSGVQMYAFEWDDKLCGSWPRVKFELYLVGVKFELYG